MIQPDSGTTYPLFPRLARRTCRATALSFAFVVGYACAYALIAGRQHVAQAAVQSGGLWSRFSLATGYPGQALTGLRYAEMYWSDPGNWLRLLALALVSALIGQVVLLAFERRLTIAIALSGVRAMWKNFAHPYDFTHVEHPTARRVISDALHAASGLRLRDLIYLAIAGAGVAVIGELGSVVRSCASAALAVRSGDPSRLFTPSNAWGLHSIAELGLIVLVTAILPGAMLIVNAGRLSRTDPRWAGRVCRRCGYELASHAEQKNSARVAPRTCPECGCVREEEGPPLHKRRSRAEHVVTWAWAAVLLVLFVLYVAGPALVSMVASRLTH